MNEGGGQGSVIGASGASNARPRWHLVAALPRPKVAIPLLALGLAVVHPDYLAVLEPLPDERFYLEAGELHLAGRSPYSHPYFNYPPPLAQLVATAIRDGWTTELLRAWRLANLAAIAALAWFAARRTGWSGAALFAAAVAVAFSPAMLQALLLGNLTPVVCCAALAAFALERRRPWIAAALLGASVALKPVALAGAAFLTGHRLWRGRRGAIPIAAAGWPLVVALALAPQAALLPEMLGRMSSTYLDAGHLSMKGLLDGLGFELSAVWIAGAVVAVALVLGRRRDLRPEEIVLVAPVVALAALPVVWGHTFTLTLPLQLAAVARLVERLRVQRAQRDRRESGSGRRGLGELVGVGLAIAILQVSALAPWVNDGPAGAQRVVSLLPVFAPAALLAYVLGTAGSANGSDERRRAEIG